MTAGQSAARELILGFLREIRTGQLTVVENGRRRVFGHGSP
jgi:hypothetical protein